MKDELNENVGPFSWGKGMLASGLDGEACWVLALV